ncbi:hypothetical protein CDD80_1515 [Ophiocordyceps camponoti-rufipedis]|uniref:Uncharacterized protein n=1 Tax=Ophiocordyceps camponoti-rufipedis TaxID=2004952 RepID=A0A2C5Z3R4_9HYPO|nr:hypothetical protein CDD80_1515 [Ophiocordyceps camponoti-rufipedis]
MDRVLPEGMYRALPEGNPRNKQKKERRRLRAQLQSLLNKEANPSPIPLTQTTNPPKTDNKTAAGTAVSNEARPQAEKQAVATPMTIRIVDPRAEGRNGFETGAGAGRLNAKTLRKGGEELVSARGMKKQMGGRDVKVKVESPSATSALRNIPIPPPTQTTTNTVNKNNNNNNNNNKKKKNNNNNHAPTPPANAPKNPRKRRQKRPLADADAPQPKRVKGPEGGQNLLERQLESFKRRLGWGSSSGCGGGEVATVKMEFQLPPLAFLQTPLFSTNTCPDEQHDDDGRGRAGGTNAPAAATRAEVMTTRAVADLRASIAAFREAAVRHREVAEEMIAVVRTEVGRVLGGKRG